jgi:hypothetical protein
MGGHGHDGGGEQQEESSHGDWSFFVLMAQIYELSSKEASQLQNNIKRF